MDNADLTVARPEVDEGFVDRFLVARVAEEESRRFADQSAEMIDFTLLAIPMWLGEVSASGQATGATTPSASFCIDKSTDSPAADTVRPRIAAAS